MNSIIARSGGLSPVLVLDPHTVFGVAHAAGVHGAVVLTKDGLPYISPGEHPWQRYVNDVGVEVEEGAENFTYRTKTELNDGRWLARTYRSMPLLAVNAFASVEINETVVVESLHRDQQVTARVVGVNAPAHYVVVDYPAEPQKGGLPSDDGSTVRNLQGVIVGFVSRGLRNEGGEMVASTVVMPSPDDLEQPVLPPPDPPTPPPGGSGVVVPPLPPGTTMEGAYRLGYCHGWRALAGQIKYTQKLLDV